jgi:hypothetical protein
MRPRILFLVLQKPFFGVPEISFSIISGNLGRGFLGDWCMGPTNFLGQLKSKNLFLIIHGKLLLLLYLETNLYSGII